MWQDQANYKPVFGAREKVAASDMMTVLEAEHIPYRIHPDSGQVMVPSNELGKVRMLLAAKGVTAQLPAGLELMDSNDPLGVSQFVQDVRFRRGLEGELAQSILTLDAIASARVHLAIAKSNSFVAGAGDQSSASVVIATKPGHTLGNEQIAAIVNMVSGSVASLNPAARLAGRPGRQLPVLARRPVAKASTAPRKATRPRSASGRGARQRQRAARRRCWARTTSRSASPPTSTTTRSKRPRKNTAKRRRSPAKRCAKRWKAAAWRWACRARCRTVRRWPPIRPRRRSRRRRPAADKGTTTATRARTPPPASTPMTARSPRSSVRAAACSKLSVAVVLNNASAANAKTGYTAGRTGEYRENPAPVAWASDAARGDVLAVSA